VVVGVVVVVGIVADVVDDVAVADVVDDDVVAEIEIAPRAVVIESEEDDDNDILQEWVNEIMKLVGAT
jgi:hypothetical protein